MSRDKTIPFQQPRRRERAVEETAWIRELLARAPLGTVAAVGPRGLELQVHFFVFDPATTAIYLHGSKDQSGWNGLERQQVAFSMVGSGPGTEHAAVVFEGTSRVVHGEAEAARARDLLMSKAASHHEWGGDVAASTANDLAQATVLRFDIESWSGKSRTPVAPVAFDHLPLVAAQHAGW